MGSATDVVEKVLTTWRARDAEAFSQCYSADAEITCPGGMRFLGRDGARQFLGVWSEAMPDNEISVTTEYVAGSVVVQEAVFSGTHSGNLATPNGLVVSPTGRQVRVPYVDIFVVEGDQVASDHLYWDQVEMLTQ
jgi:ketosteroid isomerase-like protein